MEAGRRVFAAARDLMLAAACSAIDPGPVFTQRKPDEAMRLLDRARFGQTERGSFVLTMESSLPPRLQQSLIEDTDPEAPLERKTCVRLAQALHSAEGAVRESAAAGILRAAATQLREEACYPATQILGSVMKLDSPNPEAGGEVVIQADLDGRLRQVKVLLGTTAYQDAIQSHSA